MRNEENFAMTVLIEDRYTNCGVMITSDKVALTGLWFEGQDMRCLRWKKSKWMIH